MIKKILVLPIDDWIIQHCEAAKDPRKIKAHASHFQIKFLNLERIHCEIS
jgi:hypothetical protein